MSDYLSSLEYLNTLSVCDKDTQRYIFCKQGPHPLAFDRKRVFKFSDNSLFYSVEKTGEIKGEIMFADIDQDSITFNKTECEVTFKAKILLGLVWRTYVLYSLYVDNNLEDFVDELRDRILLYKLEEGTNNISEHIDFRFSKFNRINSD